MSHKSAEKEFGLTFDEIVAGIRAGKLQYRENSIYGAPFLRLIRSEVEALVVEKYGKNYLNKKKWKKGIVRYQKDFEGAKRTNVHAGKQKSRVGESFGRERWVKSTQEYLHHHNKPLQGTFPKVTKKAVKNPVLQKPVAPP